MKFFSSIWLGAKLDPKTNSFHWDVSNSSFTHENFEEIKNNTDYKCVEMILHGKNGKNQGKLTDASCNKKNHVVCQKMQDWTFALLLEEIFDLKKQYDNQINQLKQMIKLKEFDTSIPIDFIYVQLPNQSEPTTIWLKLKWGEITSEYANMFFRAEGTKTKPFGQLQNEDSPKLSKVDIMYRTDGWYSDARWGLTDNITPGQWSTYLLTGDVPGHFSPNEHMRFYVSDAEVRPKNTAIKIWKRIQ